MIGKGNKVGTLGQRSKDGKNKRGADQSADEEVKKSSPSRAASELEDSQDESSLTPQQVSEGGASKRQKKKPALAAQPATSTIPVGA